jgi:hypothetical protein
MSWSALAVYGQPESALVIRAINRQSQYFRRVSLLPSRGDSETSVLSPVAQTHRQQPL